MTYNARMPKLAVEGYATVDVQADKRLVLAIEQDVGVDVMHACGDNARCTTCSVEFIEGEPSRMTAAEKGRLAARGLAGVRLSCQILCDHDMAVRAISRLEGTGRPDLGWPHARGDDYPTTRVELRPAAKTPTVERSWWVCSKPYATAPNATDRSSGIPFST